jgi:exodeoxyribonuclease VII small subunit
MEMKIEQALNRLTEIVNKLEENETSLEDSLALYKEGLALSKSCGETLNHFEEEVLVLQKESEGIFITSVFNAI